MEKDIKNVVRYYKFQAMKNWMGDYMLRAFKWVMINLALYLLFNHFILFKCICYGYIAIFMFFWVSIAVLSVIIFFNTLFNYNMPHCIFGKKFSIERQFELITKDDKEIHEGVHELIVEDYYEVEDIRYKAILIRHFGDLYKALEEEYVVVRSFAEVYDDDKNNLDNLRKFIKKLYKLKTDIVQFFSEDSELVELAEGCFNNLINNYKESRFSNI